MRNFQHYIYPLPHRFSVYFSSRPTSSFPVSFTTRKFRFSPPTSRRFTFPFSLHIDVDMCFQFSFFLLWFYNFRSGKISTTASTFWLIDSRWMDCDCNLMFWLHYRFCLLDGNFYCFVYWINWCCFGIMEGEKAFSGLGRKKLKAREEIVRFQLNVMSLSVDFNCAAKCFRSDKKVVLSDIFE